MAIIMLEYQHIIAWPMSRKRKKVIYPLLCLKGKRKRERSFFAPWCHALLCRFCPQPGRCREFLIMVVPAMGFCCMLLSSSSFPPTYTCTCACVCVLPKPLQLKGSLKWGYIKGVLWHASSCNWGERGGHSKLIAFSSCSAVKEHFHFLMVDTMTTLQNKEKTCHDTPVQQPPSSII